MDELWADPIAMMLALMALGLAMAGIGLLVIYLLHTPGRRHPTRRRLPAWLTVLATLLLGTGVRFAVTGPVEGLGTEGLRARLLSCTIALLGAVILQWGCVIIYVEAGAGAFTRRGFFGGKRTVRYADIVSIEDSEIGTLGRTGSQLMRSRDGTTLEVPTRMIDWGPHTAWRNRVEQDRPR